MSPISVCVSCGLTVGADGVLAVDVCTNAAIGCGDWANDADGDCLYVLVAGQGTGPCIGLASAQNECPSGRDCNGVVVSCEGLWAPPKSHLGFWLPDIQTDGASLNTFIVPINTADLPFDYTSDQGMRHGPLGQQNDVLFGEICNNGCNTARGLIVNKARVPSFQVNPGEHWRFTLWERLAIVPALNNGPLTGTPWQLQDQRHVDASNATASYFTDVTLFDESSLSLAVGECGRGETLVTVNLIEGGPVIPGGNPTIPDFFFKHSYRANIYSAHCEMPNTPFGSYNL